MCHGGCIVMTFFDAERLLVHTHDLAKSFIERHYPEEVSYFPLLWERFIADRLSGVDTEPLATPGHQIPRLGLPFAEHRSIELAGALATIAIWTVLCQLNLRGKSPELSSINSAIQASAVELGADDHLADELARELGPRLYEMFQKLGHGSARVYLEWLEEGLSAPESKILSQEEAIQIVGARHYDIVVNESAHTLRINGNQDAREILGIPGMQRAMLWLVLTHVHGYITFRDINSLRRPWSTDGAMLPEKSFYAYRHQLGRLLGPALRNRVIAKAREKSYFVEMTDVSFCWIRMEPDKRTSELLQGLGMPRT